MSVSDEPRTNNINTDMSRKTKEITTANTTRAHDCRCMGLVVSAAPATASFATSVNNLLLQIRWSLIVKWKFRSLSLFGAENGRKKCPQDFTKELDYEIIKLVIVACSWIAILMLPVCWINVGCWCRILIFFIPFIIVLYFLRIFMPVCRFLLLYLLWSRVPETNLVHCHHYEKTHNVKGLMPGETVKWTGAR